MDNGSTDNTAEVVRTLKIANMPVILIDEPRPGLSVARNRALAAAHGHILLFTDDDVRLPTDWIQGMCAPILSGTADAVAGKVVLAPHLHQRWMQPLHRIVLASTEYMKADAPGVLFGASMAFSRDVLTRVPAFDPELGAGALGAGEETLFSWQLLEAGYKITTAFDVPVEHHPEPGRLSRASYLRAARTRAQCHTYIRYHWMHAPAAQWQHRLIPSVLLTLLVQTLRLWVWRGLHWRACCKAEGIEEQEFKLVERLQRIRHYLQERHRPRHYEPYGLIKHERG